MNSTIISIAQALVAVLLMLSILMQVKGSGLSATFGGGGEVFSTKRGVEKLLHHISVALAALFVALSIWQMFI